jgi:RNA polymerase primary sigma factor
MEIADICNMDREQVVELMNISRDMISLETPVHSGTDTSMVGDFIIDQRSLSPIQNVERDYLRVDIEKALNTLDTKEAAVLRCRYGLEGSSPMSLKELGTQFNLTKERIRQIEKKAVSRLKHPARSKKLRGYVA